MEMQREPNLREAQFALWETILYLDAYPDDEEALAYYREMRDRVTALAEAEERRGPLTPFTSNGVTWDWISGPWPWESEAN